MTGSFMGMIGAVVNYVHLRSEYFAKFAALCWDVIGKLKEYQVDAELYNEVVDSQPKAKMIKYSISNRADEEAKQKKMEMDFETFAHRCCSDTYAPFFFRSSYQSAFEALSSKIEFDYKRLSVERLGSRVFWMLAIDNPPALQSFVLGDPDVFYEETCQKSRDYRDLIVSECNTFADLIGDLCNTTFRRTLPKSTINNFEFSAELAMYNVDKEKVCDVREERGG
jgi:hypothetical protein